MSGVDVAAAVTITDRRTPRGSGVAEFHGEDRQAVHEAAQGWYRQLDRELRSPTIPTTHPGPQGGWVAVISYWGCE